MRHSIRISISLSLLATLVACGGKKASSSDAPTTDAGTPPGEVAVVPDATPGPDPDPLPVALYETKNVPAQFSVAVPGSIAVSDDAGLRLDDPPEGDPTAPDSSSSHGLSELSEQIQTLQDRILYLTQNFALADNEIEKHKADCDDGCTIEHAKGKLSAEMVALILHNGGGEDALSDDDKEMYEDMIDTDIELGTITVEILTNDPNGYTKKVSVKREEGGMKNEYGMSFSADYKAVQVYEDSSGTLEMTAVPGGEMGPPPMLVDGETEDLTFDTKYRFTYDANKGSMAVSDKSEFMGNKFENAFLLQADADNVEKNGLLFNVTLQFVAADGNFGYYEKLNGLADNDGAYIRTEYSFDTYTTDLTLSAASAVEGTWYEIFAGGTTAADLNDAPETVWQLSVGSFIGDVTGGAQMAMYYGPPAASFPSNGLPIFSSETDYDTGVTTYADAGFFLDGITQTKSRMNSGYEEYIDATGTVTGYCFYDAAPGQEVDFATATFCSADDLSSDYATGFYEEVGEGGEFVPEGQLIATVSGVNLDAVGTGGFYMFRNQADFDAAVDGVTAGTFEGMEASIGGGYYIGPDYTEILYPNLESIADFYTIYYYGSEDDAAGAIVAKFSYDAVDGTQSLTEVANAVVTITVAE